MTVRPCHLDESRECYAEANYRIRCEMNKEKAEKYDKEIRVVDTTCLKALGCLEAVKKIVGEMELEFPEISIDLVTKLHDVVGDS